LERKERKEGKKKEKKKEKEDNSRYRLDIVVTPMALSALRESSSRLRC